MLEGSSSCSREKEEQMDTASDQPSEASQDEVCSPVGVVVRLWPPLARQGVCYVQALLLRVFCPSLLQG